MNSLNIELTNCFGIDSLSHEFIFEKGNVFSIYARNTLVFQAMFFYLKS